MVKYLIWLLWLTLVIMWNYSFPQATPFEDCFVSICLAMWADSLNRELVLSGQTTINK